MNMDLNPDLKLPRFADIGVRFVPEDEKEAARAFQDNLSELKTWSEDFSASLALYDLCAAQPRGEINQAELNILWRHIAARNGGLALRNFLQSLAAARGVVGRVKFWAGKIDLQHLKAIDAEFRQRFPNIDKLRHSVAHPEHYADPKIDMTGAQETTELPGIQIAGGVQIQAALIFRTYAATINGLTVSYDLTIDNARVVADLARRAFSTVTEIVDEAARYALEDYGDSALTPTSHPQPSWTPEQVRGDG